MEYPFKDLMPLDEATARDGYYKDWTHIDADTFHQISELVKFIRDKGYGADTREAIAQALERVYYDATQSGNANMEVSMARGDFDTLGNRLSDTTAQLADKADQATINEAISDTKTQLTQIQAALDTKVNISGSGEVKWANIGQDAREQIIGNTPPAVVGVNSVITENITNNAVDYYKLADGSVYGSKLNDGFDYKGYVFEGSVNNCLATGFYRVSRAVSGLPAGLSSLSTLYVNAERGSSINVVQRLIDTVDAKKIYFRTFKSTSGVVSDDSGWINLYYVNRENIVDEAIDYTKTDFINLYINDSDPYEVITTAEMDSVQPSTDGAMWSGGSLATTTATEPYKATRLIEIKPNYTYKTRYRSINFFDANGSFTSELLGDNQSQTFVTPENARYIGITIAKSIYDSVTLDRITPHNQEAKLIVKNLVDSDGRAIVSGGGGEAYDQSLNTTDSVRFANIQTDALEVTGDIKVGTLANPPSGLLSGDMWADTTDSATHPIVRVEL